MKNYLFHVGVDISKLKLDVVIISKENPFVNEHFIVENTSQGVKSILKRLSQQKIDLNNVLFCCENTGVYTYPLSYYLHKINLDCWVVAAIEIKRSKGISRGKTDKTDAKDIALYSIRNIDKLKLNDIPEKEIQQLKLLFTEREKYIKMIALMETTQENKGFIDKEVYTIINLSNRRTIKALKTTLKQIEQKMKDIVKSQETLQKQFELIRTIPGIGEQTALYLIITTKGFKTFSSWRKLACYSGIAPFEYSSGSSVRGRTKVNHMADKKLKSLLQMCAMTTIKYDPQIKEYYNKKKAEGKNSMLVLNNVRCKIISRVFAVINRQTPYINTFKFAS